MICPNCKNENPENLTHCQICGYSLIEEKNKNDNNFVYAGFWRRFFALIIDNISISLISLPLLFLEIFKITGFIFGWFLLNYFYFSLFESSKKKATLGKMALGIIVTDINGEKISFKRASARYLLKFLSASILFIGFIIAAFTSKKQALHDIIAETLVIKNRRSQD